MNFKIIPIRGLEDLLIIRDIAFKTWPHTFADILSENQIDYMLDLLYAIPSLKNQVDIKGHKFLIGLNEDVPVGFASYELNYNDSTSAKLHKLYFLPITQGRGFGRAMLEELKSIAREQKQSSIILNVNKYNKAIQFYEHQGFHKIKEEVIDIGSGYLMDDYVMELVL